MTPSALSNETEMMVAKILRRYESDVPEVKQHLRDGEDRLLISALLSARALITELQSYRSEGWQPIETAPKDGTRILGYNFKGATVMQWSEAEPIGSDTPGLDAGWISIDDRGAIPACPGFGTDPEGQPTHWQPLPAPPAPLILAGVGNGHDYYAEPLQRFTYR